MASFRAGQLVRQFCSSAVRHGKIVNAPIQVFGTEGRYAHALFSAASKEKKLDAVEKELQGFQGLLAKDKKLSEFVANPTIKKTEKKNALETVMKKQNYSNLTTNLIAAMAENGRLNKVGAVISAFAKIMAAHRGEVVCTVTTAKALEPANEKDLRDALKGFLKPGQSLQVTLLVDPSLIGGMVVTIGDKYVDMSMATKIKNCTNLIKQAV